MTNIVSDTSQEYKSHDIKNTEKAKKKKIGNTHERKNERPIWNTSAAAKCNEHLKNCVYFSYKKERNAMHQMSQHVLLEIYIDLWTLFSHFFYALPYNFFTHMCTNKPNQTTQYTILCYCLQNGDFTS